MENILITGGCGFIGSNFIKLILDKLENARIINIDLLTYAGSLDNISEFENNPRFKFIKGDITDKELVNSIFEDYSIDTVVHFAAESHVDNSIDGPEVFVRTNVLGTFVLLNTAYNCWMEGPNKANPKFKKSRFINISTDEVYGSLGENGLFTECTPYSPNSPYSASKASADMIARSYYKTYGMNVINTNCSNNYGPCQHREKLIPTIIYSAINNKEIPIYGDGKNIRDWIYVEDHCRGILSVLLSGREGETYNIGASVEKTNVEIAENICSTLDGIIPKSKGSYVDQIRFVKDRPGHDRRYAIDSTKITEELGWKPNSSFEETLKKTINWYLERRDLG